MEGLTVGRIVHYVEHLDLPHRAAIVVALLEGPGEVVLNVFHPQLAPRPVTASHDPDGDALTWHWIERA